MSIKAELENTKKHLRTTRKAILGRGGEISLTAGLKDLPNAIMNIPADASLAFYEDDEVAYRKTVPSGAEEYALVKSIGGMSYKSENLIDDKNTYPTNIGDYTINCQDGIYTVNGNGESGSFAVRLSYIDLNKGTYYLMANNGKTIDKFSAEFSMGLYLHSLAGEEVAFVEFDTVNSFKTITIEEDGTYEVSIGYANNSDPDNPVIVNIDNFTFTPKLVNFEGFRHSKVTELVSKGANLINDTNSYPKTVGGVTIDFKDGVYTLNGVCTATAGFTLQSGLTLPSGTYTLMTHTPEAPINSPHYLLRVSNNDYSQSFFVSYNKIDGSATYTLTTDTFKIESQVRAGEEYNNFVFKPMLVNGDGIVPFKPYVGTLDTLEIPEEARNRCEGYGHGAITIINGVVQDTAYNAIEFASDGVKYRQNVTGEVTLTGKNSWSFHKESENYISFSASKIYLSPKMETTVYAPIMCPNFDVIPWADIALDREFLWYYTSAIGICVSKTKLEAYGELTDNESKRNAFKAWLNDNPVTVIYKLANPIETDITEYFARDNFLKVEGGGSTTPINEHKNAVPTTIKYTLKVGS